MPDVAHYRLGAPLGVGGMGAVYRAYDTRLERTVALKFPGRTASASAAPVDDLARVRLLQEARLASALNHPHICTIYEVGEADGQVYIAMELVVGRPLSALLSDGAVPIESLVRVATQITDAVAHAHERGVIHGDLKSANVVVTPEGSVKLLDFGVARRMRPDDLAATRSQTSLPGGDTIAGTLAYLAPGVLRGQPADGRSDLWALGVLLYELAKGELPFHGRTGFELSAAILREPPPPLPARVLASLRAVIQRCVAKEPAERYQHATEVRAALDVICPNVGSLALPPATEPTHVARLLIAEDEPTIAFGLQADLKLEGYDVEWEPDGERALQRARQEIFDLILLDVMLPHKDGYEMCRELRRGGSKTPIILVTAMAHEAEKILGLELGADDYVTKPFSPRELRARIKAVLRGRGYGIDA